MRYCKTTVFFLRLVPIIILTVTIANRVSGQELYLDVNRQPLNEVLIDIMNRCQIEISFDDKLLSRYKVTCMGNYPSPESAIRDIIREFPLEIEKNEAVIVILPVHEPPVQKTFLISGQVLDRYSTEALPFSHVIINNRGMVTDLTGNFSLISETDSVLPLRVSYLGYFILDTVITAGLNQRFFLTPSMVGLTEVEIVNATVSRSGLMGEKAGQTKLNHQIANFLPGFGDNSIFNLLRLQPGILAAGELTNDLVIWGSYEGHSKVMFDGFTVYSLKNFNDNISSFNPLMAKDIEVYKGGYDAKYGDRTGGIVNITGKNGNMTGTSFTMNVNNMTLNSMVEFPLFKRSSLVIAFRTTYYELYNPSDINARLWRNRDRDTTNDINLNIIPEYRFLDMNIKYSAQFREKDLFYVSLYGGNDRFSYVIDQPLQNVIIQKNTRETNRQGGGAVFYGRNWQNGAITNFMFSYSNLQSDYTDELMVENRVTQQMNSVRDLISQNLLRESTLQADHQFTPRGIHRMETGFAIKSNMIDLKEDTFNIVQADLHDNARRMVVYFQDEMSLGGKFKLKPGLRVNRIFNLQKFYLEPRLSLSFEAGRFWNINAAWGIYDQFIARSSVVDDLGNYRYLWSVCDNENVPVLTGNHLVFGTSYDHNGFTFNMEAYYKKTKGLTRFVRNTQYHSEGIFQGAGRSYGVDMMMKMDYRGHSAWIAYSLSRTEEKFEYFLRDEYRGAPHDQRHELKTALLLNFDPFYFSADYVFGSGFPVTAYLQPFQTEKKIYSRLDVAFIYKFLDKRLKGEVGLSVLNVMNTRNIKYSNFEFVPSNQTGSINLYAEAIPITPALYLKIFM